MKDFSIKLDTLKLKRKQEIALKSLAQGNKTKQNKTKNQKQTNKKVETSEKQKEFWDRARCGRRHRGVRM